MSSLWSSSTGTNIVKGFYQDWQSYVRRWQETRSFIASNFWDRNFGQLAKSKLIFLCKCPIIFTERLKAANFWWSSLNVSKALSSLNQVPNDLKRRFYLPIFFPILPYVPLLLPISRISFFFTCRDTHFPGWIHPPWARHDVRWRLPQLSHSRLPNHVQLSTRGVGTPRHVQCVQMRGLRWARWEWWAEGELEWVSRVYLCSKNRMDVWRTATSGRVTSAHARSHVFDDRWRHLLRVHLLPRTWKQGLGPAWKHGDVYVCSGMLRNGHTHRQICR